jgi:hypothetical protein
LRRAVGRARRGKGLDFQRQYKSVIGAGNFCGLDYIAAMRAILLIPLMAGFFLSGCGNNSSSTGSAATNNAVTNFASGNPVTVVPDYIGVVGQAQKYSIKQIDLAQLNQAIQQFNAAEGRYPQDLQELVPNYLAQVPQVPAGYQISYDATTGKVKVVQQ